jgi:predicted ATPase
VNELLPRPASPPSRLVSPPEAPLRLLGRAEELNTTARVVRQTLEGSFSLTLIEGESGTGESRLLAELDLSFPTSRIGHASRAQLERHLPHASLAEAVRNALGGVVTAASPR